MVRRGASERVAMMLSGHKTQIGVRSIRDAARKIQAGSDFGLDLGKIGPETDQTARENAIARARAPRAN